MAKSGVQKARERRRIKVEIPREGGEGGGEGAGGRGGGKRSREKPKRTKRTTTRGRKPGKVSTVEAERREGGRKRKEVAQERGTKEGEKNVC